MKLVHFRNISKSLNDNNWKKVIQLNRNREMRTTESINTNQYKWLSFLMNFNVVMRRLGLYREKNSS